jgi:hypothetical protein
VLAAAAMAVVQHDCSVAENSTLRCTPLGLCFVQTVVKALSQSKRDGASKGQWRDDLDFAYGVLRRRLDPYSTFALRPYLQIAPYLGGLYYLIAFFVQQKFPAVFPTAYFSLVGAFVLPIVVLLVTS